MTDHEASGILAIDGPRGVSEDALEPRRHDAITHLDIGAAGYVIEPVASLRSHDDPLRPRTFDGGTRRRIGIDEQLNLRGACRRLEDTPDDAGRRDHRHVAAHPVLRPLVDRNRPEL